MCGETMSDISDLERAMLKCNKKCAEHDITQERIHDNTRCIGVIKGNLNKIANKVSWVIGILFLAGMLVGYGLTTVSSLQSFNQHQEGINKVVEASVNKLPTVIETQQRTVTSLVEIKKEISYMKRDIKEIKSILNRDKP